MYKHKQRWIQSRDNHKTDRHHSIGSYLAVSSPHDFVFVLLFCHFYLVFFLLSPTTHSKKTNWRINHTIFLNPLTITFVFLFRKTVFRQDWFLNSKHYVGVVKRSLCLSALQIPADPPNPAKADAKARWWTTNFCRLELKPSPEASPPLPDSCRQLNWSLQTIHVTAVTKHDFKGEIPQCFAQPTIKGNRVRSAG